MGELFSILSLLSPFSSGSLWPFLKHISEIRDIRLLLVFAFLKCFRIRPKRVTDKNSDVKKKRSFQLPRSFHLTSVTVVLVNSDTVILPPQRRQQQQKKDTSQRLYSSSSTEASIFYRGIVSFFTKAGLLLH